MPRKPNPARRGELEAAVIEYVLAHGIADLSFRTVADALGLSTYALIYHFGSKEGLVAAVVAGVEERQRQMVAAWAAGLAPQSVGNLLRRYWQWCIQEERLPYHRLFYEVYGLALQHPERFPGVLERGGWEPWTAFLRDVLNARGLPPDEAAVISAFMASMVAGALLGVLTTGDRETTTHAIEVAAACVERFVTEAMQRNEPGA